MSRIDPSSGIYSKQKSRVSSDASISWIDYVTRVDLIKCRFLSYKLTKIELQKFLVQSTSTREIYFWHMCKGDF